MKTKLFMLAAAALLLANTACSTTQVVEEPQAEPVVADVPMSDMPASDLQFDSEASTQPELTEPTPSSLGASSSGLGH